MKMKNFFYVLLNVGIYSFVLTAVDTIKPDTDYWLKKGAEELQVQLNKRLNKNRAKNVILFLGDGMSIPTLTGARAYKWHIEKRLGVTDEFLSFDKFPYSGLAKTHCFDNKVADSACSATAYLRGVKANLGTIGVNGNVLRKHCASSRHESHRVDGIATWAQNAGKSTGFVTTTAVTDSTPAGTFAYVSEKEWKCDADVRADGEDPEKCEDIASQLFLKNPGKNFNVIMGGGQRYLIPKNETDEENKRGSREDGKNLIEMWINDKKRKQEDFAYVSNRTSLLSLDTPPNFLLGIFGRDNLDFHVHKNKRQADLSEMTEAAIKVMQKNQNGYFLLVEGGMIDAAHHANKARIAFAETVEFSKAVDVAVKMTSEEDTLIVVTADHSHTMSLSGYHKLKSSIFGFSGHGHDGLPYTTINYANGPGFNFENGHRHDMTKDDLENVEYVFPSGVPLPSATHGGDDVAVFARGPYAHIFTGVYENSYIAVAMAYAAGLQFPQYKS